MKIAIASKALDILLPTHCLVCSSSWSKTILCHNCTPSVPSVNKNNNCQQCFTLLTNPEYQTKCNICSVYPSMHREMRYLWDYSDQKAQDFIKTMKYMPSRKLCKMAGYLMAENLLETFSYQDWDLIIPVPLSNASLKKRGFNQCELIAKAIISKDYKLSNFSVKRIKNIKNQASVPQRKRLNNIKNIFYANSKKVSNKSILIIDDVITTGATINALTKSLLDAGASFVDVVALARSQAWIEYQWLAKKALTLI